MIKLEARNENAPEVLVIRGDTSKVKVARPYLRSIGRKMERRMNKADGAIVGRRMNLNGSNQKSSINDHVTITSEGWRGGMVGGRR